MRIAIISARLPADGGGGAELYAAALAAGLSDAHEVTVVTGSHSFDLSVGLAVVPGLGKLPPDSTVTRKVAWHVRDQWNARTHRAIVRALRRFEPDVVHTHEIQGLSAAPYTAISAVRIPHVHTAHDLNALCMQTSMTRRARPCSGRCLPCSVQRSLRGRALAASLNTLVAPSEFLRNAHVAAGIVRPEATVVIPQGVRQGVGRLRRPGQTLRLGFIGALTEFKGIPTLLRAVRLLSMDWRLTVAGTGPLSAVVDAAASADSRIESVGWISEGRKEDFYSGLDVLVVPSECNEGAPLVVTEAAVRGIPTIHSSIGGLREAPGGWEFRPGDAAALASAVEKAYSDTDGFAATSRALLGRADSFLWSTHLERIERTLADASSASGARAA